MALVNIPEATTILASSTLYASPFFSEFFPYILISVGILVASMIAVWLGKKVIHGANHLTGHSNISQDERMSKDDWLFARDMFNRHNRK